MSQYPALRLRRTRAAGVHRPDRVPDNPVLGQLLLQHDGIPADLEHGRVHGESANPVFVETLNSLLGTTYKPWEKVPDGFFSITDLKEPA